MPIEIELTAEDFAIMYGRGLYRAQDADHRDAEIMFALTASKRCPREKYSQLTRGHLGLAWDGEVSR